LGGCPSGAGKKSTGQTPKISTHDHSGTLGRGENPYDIHVLYAYAQERGFSAEVYPYLYPPFLASAITPLTRLSPESADRMWGSLMVVMFALSVVLVTMAPRTDRSAQTGAGRRRLLLESALGAGILLLLPLGQNFLMGQVNAIVMVCMTLAVVGLEREGKSWEWGAGAALALAALIKVTPALLIVLFVARRKTGALWAFALSGAAGMGLSMMVSGPEVWGQFLAFLPQMSYGRNIDGLFHPMFLTNLSLSAFIMRALESAGPVARIVSMLAALLLVATLLWAVFRYARGAGRSGLVLASLTVMVVVSPFTWIHHLVFLYPGVFLVLRDMAGRSRFGGAKWLLLSSLVFAGLMINFPELYPSMDIPESIRRFVTSMNFFFLLGMFAIAVRYSSLQLLQAPSRAARNGSPFASWLGLLSAALRGT
jgi:alpha-1,2-mannosyltransferase